MNDQNEIIIDNPGRKRLELKVGTELAFADYRREGQILVIPYVEAAPSLRGTGAAGRLMEGVVAHARRENIKIRPLCGYAVSWFRRHPEAQDVLEDIPG